MALIKLSVLSQKVSTVAKLCEAFSTALISQQNIDTITEAK